MALFNEGLVLQNHISSRPLHSHCDQHCSGRLAYLVLLSGRCLRHLPESISYLHVIVAPLVWIMLLVASPKTVYDALKDKHPPGLVADPTLVLDIN